MGVLSRFNGRFLDPPPVFPAAVPPAPSAGRVLRRAPWTIEPDAGKASARIRSGLRRREISANEIQQGPYMARLNFLLGLNLPNIEVIQEQSRACLKLMDDHLAGKEWLELGHPTIADVACFPPVALAEEGKLALGDYKNVSAWIDRIKGLPRYVSMAGL